MKFCCLKGSLYANSKCVVNNRSCIKKEAKNKTLFSMIQHDGRFFRAPFIRPLLKRMKMSKIEGVNARKNLSVYEIREF